MADGGFHEDDCLKEEEEKEKENSVPGRSEWGSKTEYVLSLLGYAVGFGSLWRFPYLCNRNGGGAFLIPYFVGIITCGVPLFFLEVTIGQYSNMSARHVWVICPLFKGIGITQLLVSFMGSVLYIIVLAWSLYYLCRSFEPVLPWTTCDNWWNTRLCVTRLGNVSVSETDVNNGTNDRLLEHSAWRKSNVTLTAAEEFWQYNTLKVSSGFENFGSVQVHLVLCIFGSWLIAFFCLQKSVRSVGKVVYVTAVLPYILLTTLLIRTCMMPGAGEGIVYFLRPDFSRLVSVQVWLEALLQGFYSMSVTYGGLITMSSYTKFHNNSLRDVVFLTVLGEASSIFCGLVVFSTLGFMAHHAQIPISEIVTSGWKRFGRDIHIMIGKQYPVVLKLLSTYVTPLILFASLIFSLFRYDPPSYGEYIYPEYAKAIGILMAVVMSLPIPITLLHQLIKSKGTLCQRLRHASKPAYDWRPSRPENREVFFDIHLDNINTHLDNINTHLDNGQEDSSAV